MKVNRQNLPRAIPEPIKRLVRQRDGFGCIVCGSAFYQYDHLGTEFKDAETHESQQIVLLCGGCHDRKTRGVLSTETIRQHAQSPRCMQLGFSWGLLDVGSEHAEILLGTLTATNVKSLLTIDGEDVFSITPPPTPHGPFTINASLYDKDGHQILKIVRNEFHAGVLNWDVEISGPRVAIRSAGGKLDLVIRVEPPRRLIIERLDMTYKNLAIRCREGRDTTIEGNGVSLKTIRATFNGCGTAICVTGSSLAMGIGGGSVHIQDMIVSGARRIDAISPVSRLRNPNAQGRSEPCRCGSGRKYKYCHGRLT